MNNTRNTLSIEYRADRVNQGGIYHLILRNQGKQVKVKDHPAGDELQVSVSSTNDMAKPQPLKTAGVEAGVVVFSGNDPVLENPGLYYISVEYLGEKFPSTGATPLRLNGGYYQTPVYTNSPMLKGVPGTGIQSITSTGTTLHIELTTGRIIDVDMPDVQAPAGPQGEAGPEGQPGPTGKDGRGIAALSADGDALTVNFTDGTKQTLTIPTVKGDTGETGPAGTGIASIEANGGQLTVKLTDGTSYPVTVPTAQGEPGPTGPTGTGIRSITNAGDTLTLTLTDGTEHPFTIPTIQGAPGAPGQKGEAGTGIAGFKVNGDQLTVNLTDNTAQTFTIPTIKGPAGVSITDIKNGPTTVEDSQATTTLDIKLSDGTTKQVKITTPAGPQGDPGPAGQPGEPGQPGKNGRGIKAMMAGNQPGEITVEFDDGSRQSITVPTVKGETGPQGQPGQPGQDGETITGIQSNSDRVTVYTNKQQYSLTIPTVKGEQGATGPAGTGIQSITDDGKGLITITLTDGSEHTVTVPTVTQSETAGQVKNLYITDIKQEGNQISVILNDGTSKSFTVNTLTGPAGKNGQDGAKGDPGTGIKSITSSGDRITITLTDNTTQSFTIPTVKGADGQNGGKGEPGTGIQSITAAGDTLTVNLTDGSKQTLTIPTIQGQPGPAGQPGVPGTGIKNLSVKGDQLTVSLSDSTSKTFTIPTVKGDQGNPGPAGRGIASIEASGSQLVVNLTDGSAERFQIPTVKGDQGPVGEPGQPGTDGKPGADGKDGLSITGVDLTGGSLQFSNPNGVVSTVKVPFSQLDSVITNAEVVNDNSWVPGVPGISFTTTKPDGRKKVKRVMFHFIPHQITTTSSGANPNSFHHKYTLENKEHRPLSTFNVELFTDFEQSLSRGVSDPSLIGINKIIIDREYRVDNNQTTDTVVMVLYNPGEMLGIGRRFANVYNNLELKNSFTKFDSGLISSTGLQGRSLNYGITLNGSFNLQTAQHLGKAVIKDGQAIFNELQNHLNSSQYIVNAYVNPPKITNLASYQKTIDGATLDVKLDRYIYTFDNPLDFNFSNPNYSAH